MSEFSRIVPTVLVCATFGIPAGWLSGDLPEIAVRQQLQESIEAVPVISIEAAVESADELVADRNWGSHSAVSMTGAGWYRVEYGKDDYGNERVVLVNPTTGEAEYPLAR